MPTAAPYQRPLKIPTFQAIYRLASRPYGLSYATGGAGRKQVATLHHAATALKWKRIRSVQVAIESSSAAALVVADLARISTAPATGNPAITPKFTRGGTTTSECTALALPTTPATETDILETAEWNLGITAAGATTNPPVALSYMTLYSCSPDSELEPILLSPGAIDGVAVTFDASASTTIVSFVVITFSEETSG